MKLIAHMVAVGGLHAGTSGNYPAPERSVVAVNFRMARGDEMDQWETSIGPSTQSSRPPPESAAPQRGTYAYIKKRDSTIGELSFGSFTERFLLFRNTMLTRIVPFQ